MVTLNCWITFEPIDFCWRGNVTSSVILCLLFCLHGLIILWCICLESKGSIFCATHNEARTLNTVILFCFSCLNLGISRARPGFGQGHKKTMLESLSLSSDRGPNFTHFVSMSKKPEAWQHMVAAMRTAATLLFLYSSSNVMISNHQYMNNRNTKPTSQVPNAFS
jgi:hypothetical protein